ncbi:MAG: cation:proton antiporter, partial [Candidatus Dormibacteraceae bacterium]
PTDQVAVLAVFRRLGVPERLANLIEAESLLNDGTGAVVFVIAVAAAGSTGLQVGPGLVDLVRLAAGGVAIGLAVGFVLSRITMRIDDVQVELTLTAVAAYGSYLVADLVGASGILAVVCAGLVLGNYGRPRGMSERTQQQVRTVWDYATFLLETAAFLIIGLDVPKKDLLDAAWLVLPAAVIVLLARSVAVYALLLVLRPFGRSVPLRWQHLVAWSGLRGVVAVALLLTLQGPRYGEIRGVVYGVVLLSIVVQGVTMSPMARVLLRPDERRRPGAED